MLERGNILELSDDNEYTVVDVLHNDGVIYVYLVDNGNNKNVFFGQLINDEIQEIVDPKQLEKLIDEFNNNLHSNLDEINEMFNEN